MGGVYGNKWSLDSMMWLTFASVFGLWAFTVSSANLVSEREFGNYKHGRRKLDDIGGSISIDCGILDDFGYTDDKTEIEYISDKYIDSGENKNISSKFNLETLQKYLWNVRSFPQGNRNCYTIRPHEGKDTNYFIRATFMYGNYDEQDKLPEFDLYIGVNLWDKVKFENESHIVIKEIIHFSLVDDINVCLLNTGSGTPFISALELRHFHNSTYEISSNKSLALYSRFDVGSTAGRIIRYKDDVYDRMWFPYNTPQSIPFNTSFAIDSATQFQYKLPSIVMTTAVKPMNNVSLDFEVDIVDPIFYVVPNYLYSTTIYSTVPVRGPKLKFSINKTENSTLPPILNAMEVYIVKDFFQAPTDQEDVIAIMDIKVSNGVTKIWQGDPCLPRPAWDGLNCKDNGYEPPIIISLNLGSSGLTGKISPSMARFKSLEYLDLSNNSLTGPLPEFLSQMPNLRTLNLSGNELSGSVPSALQERSNNGFLSLSVDGNPDLCVMAPCKKEKKNFVVPLIAATVSALVVLTMLVVCWRCKRKQAAKQLPRTHQGGRPLKSDNRQFTYSEVVSITNNFQKIVGKGGFGTVYLGCLSDGMQVAVKMLSPSSTDGSNQFLTEAQLLMRVHHRNLTSFVGYCNEGTNFGIIYEYMEYGNLEEHLSDKTRDALSWKERLQIAVDAAQGLEYLHHGCKPPIIHRDVKTANILVNEKLQAKIADFGFSKFFTEGQSHLSTAIVGTMGYLDPEYYTSNRLTERSDVYSFGIVLLELITGKRAIIKSHNKDNTNIVDWVSPLLARGDIRNIIDPRMPGNFDTNSVWKAIETAIACVPLISIQRPSMSHVVIELKECLEIEKVHEQDCGPMTKSFNDTFEVNPLGLEMDMVPQAR
uniref:non-specific serine/threonine protein kinase n=1 Tax=Quercus lobata TaxID=97700 RepID=A0A7N2N8B6_QUELO